MKVTRLHADAQGQSHYGEVDLELSSVVFAPPASPFDASEPVLAARCVFARIPAGWVGEAHPAPCRQFFIQLSGTFEAEASDGEVRRFGPGDIVLMEDVTGEGHVTRVVGDADVRAFFVQLAD